MPLGSRVNSQQNALCAGLQTDREILESSEESDATYGSPPFALARVLQCVSVCPSWRAYKSGKIRNAREYICVYIRFPPEGYEFPEPIYGTVPYMVTVYRYGGDRDLAATFGAHT